MKMYPSISDVNLTKGYGTEIFSYINEVTQSSVSILLLISIYIITVMGYNNYKNDLKEGFAVAGWFTATVAIFFWLADFISGTILVVVMGVAIISFAVLLLSRKSSG